MVKQIQNKVSSSKLLFTMAWSNLLLLNGLSYWKLRRFLAPSNAHKEKIAHLSKVPAHSLFMALDMKNAIGLFRNICKQI